jgi:hypothetical protein
LLKVEVLIDFISSLHKLLRSSNVGLCSSGGACSPRSPSNAGAAHRPRIPVKTHALHVEQV